MPPKIQKTDAEWKALLAEKGAEPGAFQVTRQAATERAFTGKYDKNFAPGTYRCICCDAELFDAGLVPDYVAGHSIGEYAALYFARAFDFEDVQRD